MNSSQHFLPPRPVYACLHILLVGLSMLAFLIVLDSLWQAAVMGYFVSLIFFAGLLRNATSAHPVATNSSQRDPNPSEADLTFFAVSLAITIVGIMTFVVALLLNTNSLFSWLFFVGVIPFTGILQIVYLKTINPEG